ncbi:MAG TPA: hypothetical protein VFN23_02885, partial [Ktedonobacteraceae bacterium]|nr:hypothetical protein [Ktedonobacteraceae bacterium]
MSFDADEFGLSYHSEDGSPVLAEYIQYLANRQLIQYKRIVHTGGKAGESLWTHIMNLVTTIEKLRPLFKLTDVEMRVLLLALTIHDLNKLAEYRRPGGATRDLSYANAVTSENIETELKEKLKVGAFFREWEDYLNDIKYLADGHQEKALAISQIDARHLQGCRLEEDRLAGPLKFLMKIADVTDNSHSGDHTSWNEKHVRDKLINHVNTALGESSIPFRYRFIGHRIAEQRGILTNVIHNQLVAYLRERFGKAACIDLLYHPEGVDYLLDKRVALSWTAEMQQEIAERIRLRFADLQSRDLEKFIKAAPSGIHVDDAAIQSEAPLCDIFQIISNTVERKRYALD